MATLAGLSETGNAYSITITDTSVDAAALNTLDGKTTVAINASNITTLTGAAADLNTAYTANDNGSISGLSNEDVTLSDTTLDVSSSQHPRWQHLRDHRCQQHHHPHRCCRRSQHRLRLKRHLRPENEDVTLSDTTLDVSILNTLDGNTSGTIDASNITTLTGAAADLNTAYTANDNGSISGLSNEDVTLSDTTLDVSILNTLDGNTSGTIDASSITTLTGAAADLNTAYASNGITGLDDEDVTLSDTTLDVSILNTLDGNTSGTIDASSITTLNGAADDLITAYASNGSFQRTWQ